VGVVPNREMAVDWWVSPWRGGGGTTTVGNAPRTALTQSMTWTRGRKRKGACDADVAMAEESEGEKKRGECGGVRRLSFERRQGRDGGWLGAVFG
jgi:hypothetical protein